MIILVNIVKMNDVLYIIAGNWSQANSYAYDYSIEPWRWKYVYDINVIKGLRNIKYVYVGTYYERPDIDEIESMIYIMNYDNEHNIGHDKDIIPMSMFTID